VLFIINGLLTARLKPNICPQSQGRGCCMIHLAYCFNPIVAKLPDGPVTHQWNLEDAYPTTDVLCKPIFFLQM